MPERSKSFAAALVEEDICPVCLGELDTGWECNDCGYDAMPLMGLTEEEAQKAYDEAVPVPISDERIEEIVEFAISACPRCEGTGRYKRLWFPEGPCSLCNGTGKLGPDGKPAE